ncbi:ABC transporter substrate-binding protein [Dysgonomonas sp. Marseille-P4677]|uniref:ABC transporter substrate-binding protein n=1 Tax=Dysgonomonas sp. Marseille-P4677 TaxID=2364790 RepID=UPI0019120DC6|nr:ABC transporter substrate-binding protein [Dysgonomonas sp. Marseille-P4677]MBK5720574.1 ABC transporter substrate-binding protein [Dysgonomonas sp. Marseille-P4677]
MKFSNISLLIFFIFILAACNNRRPAGESNISVDSEYKIHYAKGFQVKKYEHYTIISVRDPWDTTRMLQTYILVDKTKDLPLNLPKGTIVKVPLNSVATYSTIHCSILNELDAVDLIKGVCEPQYIKLSNIQNGIKNGEIIDLGMASKPDTEKLIMLSPDAIFATPIQGWTYGSIEKTGIPILETIDYTESHPLGRAEWIRFYSLFIGKEHLADSLFAVTEKSYNNIKEAVAKINVRPSVFTDMRYQGKWNMPGGKSFMANMLTDAGASYPWSDNNASSYMPLTFETVLDKAGDADFWIIKYNWPEDMTYKALEKEYKPYSYFKAFKEKNIYGCNTAYSSYYEDLPIHPDYILKDMAYIFHPELYPEYVPKYYKKIGE